MKTFLNTLNEIRDKLLERIPVFNEGYAYARLDTKKGITVTVGNEGRYVSINDVDGDYFYMRVPEAIKAASAKARTDAGVASAQRYSCTLVAAVKHADEFALSDAIVNELLRTKVIEVKAIWIDAIAIIEQEFKGLDKNTLDSVKARIGDRTLVRVDFDMTRTFETHNCTYQICKPC
jgi:hypothetical protein